MLDERDRMMTGPVLSDGTAVRELFDLDRHEVSLRVFHDPEVFELEQEYLFGRSWTLLAHESEVPNPGDFVMRQLGLDPVIVTRRPDGKIDVLLNVCTHRGMQVCRAEVGNATKFRCPYHGWVFGPDGSMLAAPFEKEMYGDVLDKASLGLQRARVEEYAGIVFATWDHAACTIDEYLGDYRYYLDTIFCRSDDGLEVVGPPHRFVIPSNWKAGAEQFCGADGYHAVTLHRSMMYELTVSAMGERDGFEVRLSDPRTFSMVGVDVDVPQGHGTRCVGKHYFHPGMEDEIAAAGSVEEILRIAPPQAMPPEMVPQLWNNLSADQIQMLATMPPVVGGLFPNIGYLNQVLHTFVPMTPDTFQLVNWVLVEKGASAEFKDAARQHETHFWGTTGMFEQDDAEAWPGIQRSVRGVMGRRHTMKYRNFMGNRPPEGWTGGGSPHGGMTCDDGQWAWWMRYRDFMVGDPWA